MISTINPESILNIIKNQFFSIIRREKDTFGNINIDISLERQYIQYEESVENTIYIVVSLKPSDIILKQIVQPLEIYFISEHNNISLCQKLLLEYSTIYNLKFSEEESLQQIYNTPEMDDPYFEFFEGFRGLFAISGSFVYTPSINNFSVYYYPRPYVVGYDGDANINLNKKMFVEKMAYEYGPGKYEFNSESEEWHLYIDNVDTDKYFTIDELKTFGIVPASYANFYIDVNAKKNIISKEIKTFMEGPNSLNDLWIDEDLLLSKVNESREYIFEYNESDNKWIEKNKGTSIYFLSQYGIYYSGEPKTGDRIIINVGYCKEEVPLITVALNLKAMPDSQVFFQSNNTTQTVVKAKTAAFSFTSYLLNTELLNRGIAIHNEDYTIEPDGEDAVFKFEFNFLKSKQKIVRYYKCMDMNINYSIGELPGVNISFSK